MRAARIFHINPISSPATSQFLLFKNSSIASMSYYHDDSNYNEYGGRGRGGGYRRGGGRGRGNQYRRGRGRGDRRYHQQHYQQQQYYHQQHYQPKHESGIEYPPNLNELLKNLNKKGKDDIISIDGSKLEGGGQILRNSMAFAALNKQPIHITKIRAGRSKPGLASQHLQGILLTQKIFGGYLSGAYLRSMEVLYIPSNVNNNKHESEFLADTETAGSVCLLLQSSLPLLFHKEYECNITLKGGTNASFAPQIDYFSYLVKPMFERLFGLIMKIRVNQRGFYPKGGGEVIVTTTPIVAVLDKNNNNNNNGQNDEKNEQELDKTEQDNLLHIPSFAMCKRGKLTKLKGIVVLGGNNLDFSIAEEIKNGALMQLSQNNHEFKELIGKFRNSNNKDRELIDIQVSREWSASYGTAIVLVAETENGCMIGGSGLGKASPNINRNRNSGRRGGYRQNRNAEVINHAEVGRNAAKELLTDWSYGENVCTDRHFQDQLVIFMALAKGNSKFKTCQLELHTETAIHFAELLTGAKFKITKEKDGVLIECQGIGLPAGNSK